MARRQRPQNNKSHAKSRDFVPSVEVLDRWKPQMRASGAVKSAAATVIELYDVIGVDFWTGGGITASWIADQIRGVGDLVVNINSPGGDFFEGLAIYNLLRAHPGNKTINIVGLAASAASLIACAGDDILIGAAAYVMIHNCWGLVCGDKNDMSAAAAAFAKFDSGIQVIYKTQTNQSEAQITQWMDAETWFLGQEAVDEGFATGLLSADAVIEDATAAKAAVPVMALRRAESILCQSMPRKEARNIINQIKSGKPDAAAPNGKPGAAVIAAAADGLRGILQNL